MPSLVIGERFGKLLKSELVLVVSESLGKLVVLLSPSTRIRVVLKR
jgi:hypothetical protein